MKITTFARYEWNGSQYVPVEERSYEYKGPVALCDWGADESSSPDTDSFGGNFGESNFGGGGWEDAYTQEDMDAGAALANVPGDAYGSDYSSMMAVNTPKSTMSLQEAISQLAKTDREATLSAMREGAKIGSNFGLMGAGVGSLVGVAAYGIREGMNKAQVAAQIEAEFGKQISKQEINKAVESAFQEVEKSGGADAVISKLSADPSSVFADPQAAAEVAANRGYTVDPVTGKMNFSSYDEALKYSVGSAAQRSDESWEFYKQYQQPYEAEFWTQAKTLIDPSMKLSLAYIDQQAQLIPGQTAASKKYYDEAVKGIDPTERMNTAEANVVGSFDKAGDAAADMIAQYGINPNNATFQRGVQGAEIEKAKAIAGARTQAEIDTEAENFSRLKGAEILRRGISTPNTGTGVTNAATTASTLASQAQSGASSGISAAARQQEINNKVDKTSFTDLLVQEALKGIGSTDWSKVF